MVVIKYSVYSLKSFSGDRIFETKQKKKNAQNKLTDFSVA